MRKWLLLTPLLAGILPARADVWLDPDFEGLVEDANLIAVIEVTKGGDFDCIAKVLRTLKGETPDGLVRVTGYNHRRFPPKDIQRAALHTGDRALVFLRQPLIDEPLPGMPSTWTVPTPTTGNFRIQEGKLHGGWHFASNPQAAPGVDADMVLALIEGYILHKAGKEPAAGRRMLAERLTPEAVAGVTGREDAANIERAYALHWLLCAQAAYGTSNQMPAVLAAARCPRALVQICAARALGAAGSGEQSAAALGELLLVRNPLVQGEAAKALLSGRFTKEQAVPLLVRALPTSSAATDNPAAVLDPLSSVHASGRDTMIRALTRFEARVEAHDVLVELIREDGLTPSVFLALTSHFLRFPSVQARERFLALYVRAPPESLSIFHNYLLREHSQQSFHAVMDKVLGQKMKDYERGELIIQVAEGLPRGDPYLEEFLAAALKKFSDTEARPFIQGACVHAASPAIHTLLAEYRNPSTREKNVKMLDIARAAVDLQLTPPADGRARVDAWLDLLGQEVEFGYATLFLVNGLVAATPQNLRPYSAAGIRSKVKPFVGPDALRGIRALGGPLSEDEDRICREADARDLPR